ncbi:Ethr [Trypoxylus dichotomus]
MTNVEVLRTMKKDLELMSTIKACKLEYLDHIKRNEGKYRLQHTTDNPTRKSLWMKRTKNIQDMVVEGFQDLVQQNTLTALPVCCRQGPGRYDDRQYSQRIGKAVPFVELTVAHASVLTILAISFERYYAICKPLEAGYICTKTRASLICLLAWVIAAVFTSPILSIAEYRSGSDGSENADCQTLANTFWSALYFIGTIVLFFIVPLFVLLVLYLIIAKTLISNATTLILNKHIDTNSNRARKQVILMLGTVVLSFFVCLIPFRVFTLWIIIVPHEKVSQLGLERYYNILYFCRIMLYLNSAVNPILYNLMSSKFRTGFLICSERRRYLHRSRNGTFSTTVNSCRSSTSRHTHDGYRVCFKPGSNSVTIKSCNDSPESNRSGDSRSNILRDSPVFIGSNTVKKITHYVVDAANDEDDEFKFENGDPKFSVTTERVTIYQNDYDKRMELKGTEIVAFEKKGKSSDRNLV